MKKLATLLAGTLFTILLPAQTVSHMDVFIQTHFNQVDSINGNDTLHLTEVIKEPQMFVILSDTNDITAFSIKLGTTFGGSDILERTFDFGNEGEFQDGTSYTREGNYVRILLGKYATFPAYHAQVRATVNGSQQSVVTFSGQ